MTLRSGPDGCTSGRGRMLLALAVASALLCYDPSAAAAATPKRTALALVAAGCAAWLAARAFDAHAHRKRRALAPSMPAALTAWWALCCWMLLSLLWSAQPRWESPALWTSAAVLGWCVYQLHPHGRRLVTTVVGTTVMVGASGAVLVQWLLGARGMQLHAGLGNPNWAGITIVVMLPFAWEATAELRPPRRQWARALALVMTCAALVVTRAGSAMVALALMGAMAALRPHGSKEKTGLRTGMARAGGLSKLPSRQVGDVEKHLRPHGSKEKTGLRTGMARAGGLSRLPSRQLRNVEKHLRPHGLKWMGLWRWRKVMAWLLVVMAAGAIALAPGWRAGVGRSWAGRWWIWQHSAAAAVEAWPCGVGAGGFARAFGTQQGRALIGQPVEAASRLFVNATSAHNDWLQLWVEGGMPAPFMLVMVLLLGVLWTRKRDAPVRATLLAVAVTSVGDRALQLPATSVVLVLALARCGHPARGRAARFGPRATALLAVMVAGLCVALGARRWLVERAMAAPLVLEARAARLRWCMRVDPSDGEAALAHGLLSLTLGRGPQARASLRLSEGRLHNVGTALALGNSWMLQGQPAKAARAYRRALHYQPGSFRAHLSMASAQLALGDTARVKRHLELARELQPHHPKLRRLAEQLARALHEPN